MSSYLHHHPIKVCTVSALIGIVVLFQFFPSAGVGL